MTISLVFLIIFIVAIILSITLTFSGAIPEDASFICLLIIMFIVMTWGIGSMATEKHVDFECDTPVIAKIPNTQSSSGQYTIKVYINEQEKFIPIDMDIYNAISDGTMVRITGYDVYIYGDLRVSSKYFIAAYE